MKVARALSRPCILYPLKKETHSRGPNIALKPIPGPDLGKLVGAKAARGHVLEPQRLEPLRAAVEVEAVDHAGALVQADVVEARKRRARDGPHAVVRHEELLLPAHEDVVGRGRVKLEPIVVEAVGVLLERRELALYDFGAKVDCDARYTGGRQGDAHHRVRRFSIGPE